MDVTRPGIEFDASVNALYVRLMHGTVARTVEVSPLVLVDLDENGATLGYEFVDASRFFPFLTEHGGVLPETAVSAPPQKLAV